MFYLKYLFSAFLLLLPTLLQAQEEKWNELEKERNYITDQIQKGEYLLNELKINSNRLTTHSPEEYQHWEKYFYTFDRRVEQNPPVILKAVIIKTERDGLSVYKEYMFDNAGNCIFYSESRQNYKKALDERARYFISAGKPIRWFQNDTDITFDTEKPEKIVKSILENSKRLYEKFLKQIED